jgi:hypothetical protein
VISSSVVLLAGGIVSFSNKVEFEDNLRLNMLELLDKYHLTDDQGKVAKEAWDRIQKDVSISNFLTPTVFHEPLTK